MTPYAAVARLQRETPEAHRTLCDGCAEALLEELAAMFDPVAEPQTIVLSQCSLLGCTFDYGPVDQCAMHAMLREDAACPSK